MNYGSGHEILKHLEKSLNFTSKLYKRRIEAWGTPEVYPNGSIEISDGMVRDLMPGKADMIVAHMDIIHSRKLIIDFLHPIWNHNGGNILT